MRVIGRSDGWIVTDVGDELLMMHVDHGTYIGLNPMGAHIWQLLETPREIAGICWDLLQAFEVDEQTCRDEVETFIAKMEARRIITVTGG